MLVIWNSNVRSNSLCRQVFRSYFYIPLMRSWYLTKTSILSSESGMPLLFSEVQVVLTTHSHIFPQVSLCLRARDNPALKVDVYLRTCRTYTPFSKSSCTYKSGALPLFQVFGDLRTINISLSSSPVLTNLGYFRSPILLYLRPRTFSGIHVFV